MCDITLLYVWKRIHMFDMTLYICDKTDSYVWLTHLYVFDMTDSYVWHDWFICVTWLIRMYRHSLFIYATWCHTYKFVIYFTWLIQMCVTWSIILMTCLIHECNMTHSYVCHESFVTWLMHTRDTAHAYVCNGTFICVASIWAHRMATTHKMS